MLVSDGKYLVYGANGIIGRYNEYNHEQPEVLMTCRGATCGSINISKPFSWINGNAMVVHPKQNKLGQSFLKYLLQSIDLSCVITGAAQPQITRQSLKPVKVVVPPIAEQEKIVAELDCLTGIIEKKKQQLIELDNLAQSIFYDMFGEEVAIAKGWKIKTLGEIGSFQRGGGFLKKDYVENGFPCLHYGQIHTRLGIATYKHLTCIPEALLPKTKIASHGDLIMAITSEDVEGSCKSTAWMGDYDIAVGAHTAIFKHTLNPIFASYITKSARFNAAKQNFTHGIKVVEITPKDIATISIPVPPRDLQDLFAKKIEALEHQKELIKKSIQETETLFNSRMDYWFN